MLREVRRLGTATGSSWRVLGDRSGDVADVAEPRLEAVLDDELDFGLTQSGLQYAGFKGNSGFRARRQLRSVFSLVLMGSDQCCDEPRRYEEAFGHPVSLTFRRSRPEHDGRQQGQDAEHSMSHGTISSANAIILAGKCGNSIDRREKRAVQSAP